MKAVTKLDNTIVENPNGIKSLYQELFYDKDLKCIFNRVEGDLEFHGDGYDYIEDAIYTQGVCSKIELLLLLESNQTYEGIIHIIDIREWNVSREIVKTPIADNNLSSYIFNNRNVKAYINAPKTKSGLTATAATNVVGFDLFTPSTGSYGIIRDNVYTVDKAFEFLVDFMSDGQMTYESPFFGSGGDREFLMIASALHLATDSDYHPYLSFYELFTELDKIFNLSIYIDYSGANPKMIIDLTDNLYVDTNLYTFNNVRDIKLSFDMDRMYSYVDLGSDEWQSYNNGSFKMPDVSFIGFEEERYYVKGQCNKDKGLNLVNSFILDSNSIEDMLVNQNDSQDEKIVIIESDDGLQAKQYDNYLGLGGKIYNQGLNNYSKSINYKSYIQNDLVKYISPQTNYFEAEKSPAYDLITGVLVHGTEISDTPSAYNTATGKFICPIGLEGAWSFTYTYNSATYEGADPDHIPIYADCGNIKIRHYDSGAPATLLSEQILEFPYSLGAVSGSVNAIFVMSANDYVEIYATSGVSDTNISSSTFSGQYLDEGGTYQTYDGNDFKVINIDFEIPLTDAQYKNIRDNSIKKITVKSDKKTFQGWIKSLKRNILTGISTITLTTSNRIIEKYKISR